MKTQISRNSFDAAKRYSGVYQQMGRMFTDADWNELSDLAKHRLADALTDVIGSGTPRGRGMLEIVENEDGTKSYAMRWGYAYVDGIIAQVRPDPNATLGDPGGVAFEYEHQADFPNPPPRPCGDHTLYLDVWERTVVVLEDGNLRDAGLHGADTCSRTETMAQVKWCETAVDPEDATENPPIGKAKLSLELREASEEADPCDPCADVIDIQGKIGNYLFRVEVHDVEYDGSGSPSRVVLKWSSENGAEHAAIGQEPAGFAGDDWVYEFFDGHYDEDAATLETLDSEKHLGRHLAPGFIPTRGALSVDLEDVQPGYTAVRRWDGYCELLKSGGSWTLLAGADKGDPLSTTIGEDDHGRVVLGPTVVIHLDAITLSIALEDHQMLAGDFWYAVVREAKHGEGSTLLSDGESVGIRHHYMPLGSVIDDEFTAYEGDQCRRFAFPPLTDIEARDVCYDNDGCDMPDVRTVQDVIDRLCQERDLRFHNKHLHGWGIVCGMILECAPDTPSDEGAGTQAKTRRIRLTEGYALDCEGHDIALNQDLVFDLLGQISSLEDAGQTLLSDGNGSVCLTLGLDGNGQPSVGLEPYSREKLSWSSLLDGTLLADFFEHCIQDLLEAVLAEFKFLSRDELDEVEAAGGALVSPERRKFISVLNLAVQLLNSENGSYVFLSHREHLILRDFYLQLRALLQSKTFCAMFDEDEFPDYPFTDRKATTFFGKGSHTQARLHPSGKTIYTYAGTDNTINVYESVKGELVEIIEMPAAEGAEVSAIEFSPDGRTLYAAAQIRGLDTVFGQAEIGADSHKWADMTVLCDVLVAEMDLAKKDPGLIYAIGRGKGLYFLRPQVLSDNAEKPRPQPVYAFNAYGHMVVDAGRAYATSLSDNEASPDAYDEVVVLVLDTGSDNGNNLEPSFRLPLLDASGDPTEGSDGLALRPISRRGGRLYVITGSGDGKALATYALTQDGIAEKPIATSPVENTRIALNYHSDADILLLSLEDGYCLQLFDADGGLAVPRVPAQIQPVDLAIDQDDGRAYVLNYISNTLTAIPTEELKTDDAYLNELATYRTAMLRAFFSLIGGVIQYLKDCFCHHLLIKCPTCAEDDIIYLGCVEIRDNAIHNICNFEKRKYVKSFPTVEYWLSLIPVIPAVKAMVTQVCCSILPDLFGKHRDDYIRAPKAGAGRVVASDNLVKAGFARKSIQAYQRTDLKAAAREQRKSVKLLGQLAGDSLINIAETKRTRAPGLKKQALMGASLNEAVKELKDNRIRVSKVVPYDPTQAGDYFEQFTATPQRLKPGSRVTVYEKDGEVLFYGVEKAKGIVGVPQDVVDEIDSLEKRKERLIDLTEVHAALARVEARRAHVIELEKVKTALSDLEAQKLSAAEELAALRSQLEAVKAQRENETSRLKELDAQRTAISGDLDELRKGLDAVGAMRKDIFLEVAEGRPVKDVAGVTPEIDKSLRELGIRTVKELSEANANRLVRGGLAKTEAARIVTAAKARLQR